MPYIPQNQRDTFDNMIKIISHDLLENDRGLQGKLNYIVSAVIANILKEQGTSYTLVNNLVGVLECAKLELYRRVAAPYEDTKMAESGDVYPKS